MFSERMTQVQIRCNELFSLAEAKFNLKLPQIQIRFDLSGTVAGQAGYRNNIWFIRLNADMMINQSWDHIYNNTVPHEIAHIVCIYSKRDAKHSKLWRFVCKQLGGNGARCHDEDFTYSKGKTWYYVSTLGHVVRISGTRHRRIQQGAIYTFRQLGRINQSCRFSPERISS